MTSQEQDGSTVLPRWKAVFADTRSWRNFGILLAPLVLIVCLYAPTSRSLADFWNDTDNLTYTHGWLIVAITLWLLFKTGKSISVAIEFRPALLGALCLLVLSSAWLLANRMNIQLVQQLLFPALAWAAIWSLFGFAAARACVFAIGYLYFAIPVWGVLNWSLQWATVLAVRSLVRVFSIPAYFEANAIQLPAGTIVVEGGCSGLHFVIVGLALAVLFGYVNGTVRKFRLWALALGLAVLANWVRVFTILVAGHLTNMQHYLVRVDHYKFGWAVFAVMMWVFFSIAGRMEERPDYALRDKFDFGPGTAPRHYLRPMIVLLVLGLIPVERIVVDNRVVPELSQAGLIQPPDGWSQSRAVSAEWKPVFLNADAQSMVRLQRGTSAVDVFHALFSVQRQDKKLAGFGNTPVGGLLPSTVQVIGNAKGAHEFVEDEFTDTQGRHSLVWYSYYVGTRWFGNPMQAQIWYGVQSLFTSPISGVLAFRTDCASECDSARADLAELTGSPMLNRLISKDQ